MESQPFTLLYDASGQPVSTAFAPVTGRPGQALYSSQGGLLALGSDYQGTPKAQTAKVDATGNQYVVLQTPSGTPAQLQATSTVPSVGSVYGPVVMGLNSTTVAPLSIDTLGNLVVMQDPLATFSVVAPGVAPTTGKSILALVNKSTVGSVVRLVSVFMQNTSQNTGGLLSNFYLVAYELRPITGVSAAGTTLSPLSYDSADVLDPNILAYTGATVTGDTKGPYRRWVSSNYGATAGGTQAESTTSDQQGREAWVQRADANAKHVTVRPGAGVHVKVASTNSLGVFDLTFVFTVAPA